MTRVLMLACGQELVTRVNVLPGTQVVVLDQAVVSSERFNLLQSLDQLHGIDPQGMPDLIVLGESIDLDQVIQVALDADRHYPLIDIVAVGTPDPERLVDLMRSGIRDIVATDAPEERLLEVIRRADKQRTMALPPPPIDTKPEFSRIVTVISPKGGVGKTAISSNLAIAFSARRPMDVVLVDLDLQFGDVASVLDLNPQATIEGAFGAEAAADTLTLKTMLTVHPGGFHVLCGAESPAANEDVSGAQVRRLIEQLASQFTYVVIDTASGLDESTLAALEVTTDAVVVSTMDVACMRGVRKEVALLAELGLLPESRTLALNLADKQSGLKVKDVENVVGLPVDVVIQRSSDVQLATNQGEPLMLKGPKKGGQFVKAIQELAGRFEEEPAPKPDRRHRRLEVA